jgi:ABC-type polysaccharide/polyol phosphate export permease
VLYVAYVIATYWRRELPFGRYVGTNYEWQTVGLYSAIALGLLVAFAAVYVIRRIGLLRDPSPLLTLVAGIVLSDLTVTVFLPHQSGLQKFYYLAVAMGLGVLVVPASLGTGNVEPAPPLIVSLRRLWAQRVLLRIWVHYNVTSRYTQTLLGILWIVLLPLSTALVMTAVFSQIFRNAPLQGAPFIAFFLAGFVPFGLFNQSMSAAMKSILAAMQLINQIYFPREIIVLSALGEAMVDTFFMFLAMLAIDLLVGIVPNVLFVFLVPIVLIEIVLCLGLMFIVSWLSVLIRDVPQLVSVLLQIVFYLCPIIYPVGIVPHRYQFLVDLNPLALIIVAYRDIIVYDRVPDWVSLVYPAALAVAVLVFGYRHFKANEDMFADMLC